MKVTRWTKEKGEEGKAEADTGQIMGAPFVVDAKIEDHKETVTGIFQTIRRAKDFKE